MRQNKILHLGYSACRAYERKDYDRAWKGFMGIRDDVDQTNAMKLGSDFDERFNEETERTGQPPQMFGYALKKVRFKPQVRFKMMINDYIMLHGTLDAWGPPYIIDNKVGTTRLSNYMSSKQGDVYALYFKTAKAVIYNCLNPYTRTMQVGKKHITDESRQTAKEWLIMVGDAFIADMEGLDRPWWREEAKQEALL